MYGQYPFSEQKLPEAKIKVKETDTTWSQFFPVTKIMEPCDSAKLQFKKKSTNSSRGRFLKLQIASITFISIDIHFH